MMLSVPTSNSIVAANTARPGLHRFVLLLEAGPCLCRRRRAHEGTDDPEDREEDPEPEQRGVALAERRHAEHDERGDVDEGAHDPDKRRHDCISLRLLPIDAARLSGCLMRSSRAPRPGRII